MKLQKHITKKGAKYFKWEVILPADEVKKSGFKEGDELETESKKGEIKLIKKQH